MDYYLLIKQKSKREKMKYQLIVLIAISLITFSACQEKENPEMKDSTQNVNGTHKVEVVDHMNASNYTYMLVKENESEFWIAAPQTPVEKGEIVYFEKSMVMKNFRSDVLDKTFESILFVQAVSKTPSNNQQQTIQSPHSQVSSTTKLQIDFEPLSDGSSVKNIYENSKSLSEKTVKIKGKVVKVNKGIMNRNWIHIQDGTDFDGNYDLMVTSNDLANVGDVIIVEGKVSVDKDFGAGYVYKVMIEDAVIK